MMRSAWSLTLKTPHAVTQSRHRYPNRHRCADGVGALRYTLNQARRACIEKQQRDVMAVSTELRYVCQGVVVVAIRQPRQPGGTPTSCGAGSTVVGASDIG